jgi:hypothetical protein
VDLLGAPLEQCAGAFVDGRTRRVDVVDERQGARSRTGREGAAHVVAARAGVETALGAHRARAAHERDDRHAPPARQLGRELRGRVGAPQQEAVSHRGHRGDRLDRRTRQLVHDERGGQARG